MFKSGEKVVYIGGLGKNELCTYPNMNDVVTLKSPCTAFQNAWDVLGYEIAIDGTPQSFPSYVFRKLDYEFVEEVYKQVKPEPCTA